MSGKETTMGEMTRRDFAAGETDRGPGVPSNGLANDPRAGQWDGRRMSKRMIADYKTFIVTDGEGVRNSLYVSGCPFHCVDCFNASIWDFKAGHEYTPKLEERIIEDLKASWVQGITFLGGEPLLNTPVLVPLARRIRAEFGHDKDIWCWTGYTWEELMRPGETPDKRELLELIDVLVDGRYLRDRKDSLLQFRGSSNQRILDVPKSLAAGSPVIWPKLHDQERDIPEIYLRDREAGEGAQAS
ncbi:anaerobic ribonucleoside-triphosphate reductase activating protein [Bifidobacterium moraviense]